MTDRDWLQKAVDRMDLEGIKSWLDKNPDRGWEGLIVRLRRARILVGRRATVEELRLRDDFFAKLLGFARSASNAGSSLVEIERLLSGAPVWERLYQALRKRLVESGVVESEPGTAIWAHVDLLERSAQTINADLARGFSEPIIDPVVTHAVGAEGHRYLADGEWTVTVEATGNSLKMLGYEQGLFESNGALVVPPRTESTPTSSAMVQRVAPLAATWMAVEHNEERWRWVGGAVSTEQSQWQDGTTVDEVVLRPGITEMELLNRIAEERLERYLYNARESGRRLAESVLKDRLTGDRRLPPEGWLDADEFVAHFSLEAATKTEIANDKTQYDGLTLSAWIRGYSVLRRLVKNAGRAGTSLALSRRDLLLSLQQFGLTAGESEHFTRRAIFGRDSADLFDAPAILSSDGVLHVLSPIVRTWDLAGIVLSRVRTSKQALSGKGPAFEKYVHERLAVAGLTPKRLHFHADSEEFEFDVLFVWGETLFVFECKNRGMPGTSPRRLSELREALHEDLKQLQRQIDALEIHRAKALQVIGQPWSRIVGAVVNGLPWSLGELGELCVVDASAIGKFLKRLESRHASDGEVESGTDAEQWSQILTAPPGGDAEAMGVWRRLMMGLCPMPPSVEDFEREIREPWQLRSLMGEWESYDVRLRFEKNLVMTRTVLCRRQPDLRRFLSAIGGRDADVEILASAYERALTNRVSEPKK